MAFQAAAEGRSDREVADALNAAGHRTTGNRGANPFTKDTVRMMLLNRFYLGQLPDGQGNWLTEQVQPLERCGDGAGAQRGRKQQRGARWGRSGDAASVGW
jgi:hypothetical protein